MIHLAAFVLAVCISIAVGQAMLRALIGECSSLVDKAVDTLAALFFFAVIAPLVWIWEKGRRPMWRTLTIEQTRDLQAWLRRATADRK